jgi:hypothetical protein
MFKKLLLFLSYISLSSQMFMTPHSLLPFQNKTNASIPQDYPILSSHEITQKRKKCDDALTIFKIWASLFVFTFHLFHFYIIIKTKRKFFTTTRVSPNYLLKIYFSSNHLAYVMIYSNNFFSAFCFCVWYNPRIPFDQSIPIF